MRRFPKLKEKEFRIFQKLSSPAKVQDFLNTLRINFEKDGQTRHSPLLALRRKKAHCLEGALLASAAFWYHGRPPLLMDLRTIMKDEDHVLALFKENGLWGAVSKTNHAVLRYRDPVYRTLRELAMSYFNEYFLDNGRKTLREYSAPFSLLRYKNDWLTSSKSLHYIAEDLDLSRHYKLISQSTTRHLRSADELEVKAGKLTEWAP